ncbi:aminopeptidase P family protein [Candidatus Woesearchaeota archaeon]|nr:aminopeptidase P family protein [Candidatus Woesearchaeota archaeon]
MWSKNQINQHILASKLLIKIKNQAFDLIKNSKSISEYEVQQFIINKFKEYNLKSDEHPPIVAFRQSTSNIHYYPKKKSSKKINPNSLIMIDIWARINKSKAPFSDITWMAYKGNRIPKDMQRVFNIVITARDNALDFIKNSLKNRKLPLGRDINNIVMDFINKSGFKGKMPHSTGHGLGNNSPHSRRAGLRKSNKNKLLINFAYTIEPGIYLKNKFGVRSEIDFYVNKEKKLILTAGLQKKIVKI